MRSNPLKSRMVEVRARLDLVRAAMISASSESIVQTVPELESAAAQLALLLEELSARPALNGEERREILKQSRILQAELARLATLNAGGLEFCRRWAETLQSAAGYVATGESASFGSPTTIRLEG